jgi:hypothetical protein
MFDADHAKYRCPWFGLFGRVMAFTLHSSNLVLEQRVSRGRDQTRRPRVRYTLIQHPSKYVLPCVCATVLHRVDDGTDKHVSVPSQLDRGHFWVSSNTQEG